MKNKLLLLAVALLTSWSVKAVDVIEEGVDYYILHVETDLFLGGQNDWGCKNTISSDAGIYQFELGSVEGAPGYNIRNILMNGTYQFLGTDLFGDKKTDINAGLTTNEGRGTVNLATEEVDPETGLPIAKRVDGIWTVENLGGGIFAFKCASSMKWNETSGAWEEEIKGGYLTKSATAGARKGFVTEFKDELTDDAYFRVMTSDEAKEYMIDKAQSSNVSFNFMIKNPDFCRNQSTTAWGFTQLTTPKDPNNTHNYGGGNNNNFCAEAWCSGFVCNQPLKDLPAGRYQISAQGFYRVDNGTLSGDEEIPYIYVGNAYNDVFTKVQLPLRTGTENNMTQASNSFTAGLYMIDPVRFNLENEADLEIGFCSPTSKCWVIFDNIQLMSYSNVKEYGEEILAEIDKTYPIKGLASTDVRAAYEQAYNDFSAFVAGITPGTTTFDDVDAEYAKFTAAETALKANIESWSGYTVVAEKAKTLYTQITSQVGKYNPNKALDALNSYANAAPMEPGSSASGYTFVNGNYEHIKANPTLNDEQIGGEIEFVNSLTADVKAKSVQPGMDVTFLLVNPDFTDPIKGYGWQGVNTITEAKGGLSAWPCAEAYGKSSFDFYQIVENAPIGLYKITVNAFYRPSGNGTWTGDEPVPVEIYMGAVSNPIQHIASDACPDDLTFDDELKQWNGTVAKNGTNVLFWDGNSEANDRHAYNTRNENPDPDVKNAMLGATIIGGSDMADYRWEEGGKIVPNGMTGASVAFSAGRYPMSASGEVTADEPGGKTGTLRIGLRSKTAMHWALWSNFRLELLGDDPQAMKNLLKGKIDEMNALVPNPSVAPGIALVVLDSITNITGDAQALYDNPVLQKYEDYKEAYEALDHIIASTNKYLEAFSKLSTDLTSLNNMIAAFDADTPTKQEYKVKAQNVATVYNNLAVINAICLTPEDLENEKIYEVEKMEWDEPEDVTNDNLADAAASGQDGGYVSTYSQFDAFFKECSLYLSTIYLTVDPSATAEAPEDLTGQLKNPDFETDGGETDKTQWWGTAWGNINEKSGEMYENVFETYQMVFMPVGYYTLQGFAMDRRGAWADVLTNDADWRLDDATYLYAKIGDAEEPEQTLAANAKWVAQTKDITNGQGGLAENNGIYTVGDPAVTYYAPNSMAQYRAWMDAAEGDFAFGTEISFYVPEPSFASLGFFRRAQEKASWFIADGIKLFYAVNAYPTTGIVAPTSIEKFGKADGKYLEKNQIFIYLNGKKFNTAGQIVK